MIKYYEFKVFAGAFTRDLCTENPNSKMFLARTFLFVNRFESLLHILRQTKCSNVRSKYFHLNLNSCKIFAKTQYQTLGNTKKKRIHNLLVVQNII